MWRPSGNRGGNRGRGSPGRGGSQSASPWPDSNNGRQGRRGYGENQNNQFQQKSKSDDPRNHVGMSFRGSGRPVTRPEAPGPNANLSSGGLGTSLRENFKGQLHKISIHNHIQYNSYQEIPNIFAFFSNIYLPQRNSHELLQELLKCYVTAQY
ncbi:Oidioi.mRNA.OKI2018_I69.PAR.g11082.t3.cds [Oikopleura dioica]|uniref:Oidioi.mRNA.OKI2018_I69.PAR.g11082.t3.cds n=1 Tax=Oikopleura dioica TaxID=34765 RepID=A0ABN7RX68_OIKDI|nr:Oidioi.mRNA.OKI2018_I69.PAR.g11082.t3.cds [Oikopleura dioica]